MRVHSLWPVLQSGEAWTLNLYVAGISPGERVRIFPRSPTPHHCDGHLSSSNVHDTCHHRIDDFVRIAMIFAQVDLMLADLGASFVEVKVVTQAMMQGTLQQALEVQQDNPEQVRHPPLGFKAMHT